MATAVGFRRGSESEHVIFRGVAGEITVDTTNRTLWVHDGTDQPGNPLATASMSNVTRDAIAGRGIAKSNLSNIDVVSEDDVSRIKNALQPIGYALQADVNTELENYLQTDLNNITAAGEQELINLVSNGFIKKDLSNINTAILAGETSGLPLGSKPIAYKDLSNILTSDLATGRSGTNNKNLAYADLSNFDNSTIDSLWNKGIQLKSKMINDLDNIENDNQYPSARAVKNKLDSIETIPEAPLLSQTDKVFFDYNYEYSHEIDITTSGSGYELDDQITIGTLFGKVSDVDTNGEILEIELVQPYGKNDLSASDVEVTGGHGTGAIVDINSIVTGSGQTGWFGLNNIDPENIKFNNLYDESTDETFIIETELGEITNVEIALESLGLNQQDHIYDTNNPHNVTKSQVGLGNVDNTSDANKPISTATQTALDGKLSLVGGGTITEGVLEIENERDSQYGWSNQIKLRSTYEGSTSSDAIIMTSSGGAFRFSGNIQAPEVIPLTNHYASLGTSYLIWKGIYVDQLYNYTGGIGTQTLNIPYILSGGTLAVTMDTLPAGTEDMLGKIVQYTGTTDANYTNGYFYKCVATPVSSSATASQTTGSSLTDVAVVVATFETQITTSGSYVFTSDGTDWSYDGNVVDLTDYGITYTGTPVTDDVITVVYTAATTNYSWTRTDVQPTVDPLPDQTGNAGKFLTTDGTNTSWALAYTNSSSSNTSVMIVPDRTPGSIALNYDVIMGKNVSFGSSGSNASVAVGYDTLVGQHTVSIGYGAEVYGNSKTGMIAIGYNAKAMGNHSIQLNASDTTATNSDDNTFKVANVNGNYEIMSADGTIPEARLADTTSAAQGQVLTLDSNLNAIWANSSVPTLTWYTVSVAGNTLTIADTSSAQLVKVYKNGLLLEPTADYSISGTTLTMVTALVVGDKVTTEVF